MSSSVRLYIIGEKNSGKTTLTKALVSSDSVTSSASSSSTSAGPSHRAPGSPSSSTSRSSSSSSAPDDAVVGVYSWDLNQGKSGLESEGDVDVRSETKRTMVEVWDLPGDEIYEEAHLLYLRSPCLFLVTSCTHTDHSTLLKTLGLIESKCPGSQVIMALTQADRVTNEDNRLSTQRSEGVMGVVRDWLDNRTLVLKRYIAELKSIVKETEVPSDKGRPEEKALVSEVIGQVRAGVKRPLVLHPVLINVSACDGRGMSELRRAVSEKVTSLAGQAAPDKDVTSQIVRDAWRAELQEARDRGEVVSPRGQLVDRVTLRCKTQEATSAADQRELRGLVEEAILDSTNVLDLNPSSCQDNTHTTNMAGEHRCQTNTTHLPGTDSEHNSKNNENNNSSNNKNNNNNHNNNKNIHNNNNNSNKSNPSSRYHFSNSTTSNEKGDNSNSNDNDNNDNDDESTKSDDRHVAWNTSRDVTQSSLSSSVTSSSVTSSSVTCAACCASCGRYVCVNPPVMARMICACLMTEETRTFRLEASQFWPKESGFKPPEPAALARVLEAIPSQGEIREAALPLLWQDWGLNQNQVQGVLAALESLGVLMPHRVVTSDCAGLAMPHFRELSPVLCHASVLMGRLPNNRPQLNWTAAPFPGDLQVTWRLRQLTPPTPVLGGRRVLAVARSKFSQLSDYCYIWADGLLLKFSEATLCVQLTEDGLDLSCRVNGDEPSQEEASMQMMWAWLIPVVTCVQGFYRGQLPGVVFKSSLLLHGSHLYSQGEVNTQPEVTLEKFILAWKSGKPLIVQDGEEEKKIDLDLLFPFSGEEAKQVWSSQSLVAMVMSWRSHVVSPHPENSGPRRQKSLPQQHRKTPRRKKGAEVKWKAKVVEDDEVGNTAAGGLTNTAGGGDGQRTDPALRNSNPPDTSTTSLTSSTPSLGPCAVPPAGVTSSLSRDDWLRQARGVASRFVSAMMASGVAKYVSTHAEFGPGGSQMVTTAEVTAARVTAEAALAVQTGDIEGAARAVLEAVRAVQYVATRADDVSSNGGGEGKSKTGDGQRSKMCVVL